MGVDSACDLPRNRQQVKNFNSKCGPSSSLKLSADSRSCTRMYVYSQYRTTIG